MRDVENTLVEPVEFKRAQVTEHKRFYKPKPLPLFLTLFFLVLAAVILYMFNARLVRFVIEPEPESLEIARGFPTYQLKDRFLMLPGEYTLHATADGYQQLEQIMLVSSDENQEFSYTMQKLPGILQVTTLPETTAEIFLDDELVGVAPLTLDPVSPGEHLISILPNKYFPIDETIQIEGKRIKQTLEFTLTPAWATVEISTYPPGASLWVDSKELGASPANLEILRGDHSIEIRKSGYKIWKTDIVVEAGHNQVLPLVELVKADGQLSITSRPDKANVTISGRYYGQTPLSLKLPPTETYQIKVKKSGFKDAERAITIKPAEDIELDIALSPITGVIRLSVEPQGSILHVDGVSRGDASQRLTLTASKHQLRIEKEGYAAYKIEVTPQPGLDQQLSILLKTVEEAAVEALPRILTTSLGQQLRLIIADRMTMGARRREPGRRSNEVLREVKLTRPYYLGTKEVTNKEFSIFDSAHDSGVLDWTVLNQQDRPVVNLNWDSVIKYCNWLSDREGLPKAYDHRNNRWELVTPVTAGYRLPTEAEWAWAARYTAGKLQRFPWGDSMPPRPDSGNFADESALNMIPQSISGYNDTFRGPAPVGSFTANESGIYDLAGNAAEWVHDYYGVNPQRQMIEDPTGPPTGEFHVIRGSSFLHGRFSELRWVYREFGEKPRADVGFRLARYLE